jgi:hypothetical protein
MVATTKVNLMRENTVILDVVFHRIMQEHRERTAKTVDTEANKAWLSTVKKLFESSNYSKAAALQWETMRWLKSRSLPCGLHGYFVLPTALLKEVWDYLDAQDAKLRVFVEALAAEVENLKQFSQENLKDLYNETELPSAKKILNGIWMERSLIELQVPGSSKVGDVLAKQEEDKAKSRWDEAAEEVIYALREEMSKLVAHLVDRLTPNSDGKVKGFRESNIENLLEWFDLFSKRNILNDADLKKLVAKSKEVLVKKGKPVSGDLIRADETVRAKLQAGMSEVKIKLDAMLVNVPARRIRFAD